MIDRSLFPLPIYSPHLRQQPLNNSSPFTGPPPLQLSGAASSYRRLHLPVPSPTAASISRRLCPSSLPLSSIAPSYSRSCHPLKVVGVPYGSHQSSESRPSAQIITHQLSIAARPLHSLLNRCSSPPYDSFRIVALPPPAASESLPSVGDLFALQFYPSPDYPLN